MLFDPDKLDDNDPRKIAFLKQQEDQRQKADQEVSPKESATVSKQKYRSFVKEIEKDQIFGKCIGRVSVVEFQKRGAPHTHTCG